MHTIALMNCAQREPFDKRLQFRVEPLMTINADYVHVRLIITALSYT